VGKVIEKIFKAEDKKNTGTNIIFTDDMELRQINLDFRMKDYVTDVISFPLTQNKKGYAGGDIYISANRAKKDAEKYGMSLDEEIARLVIHGALHLMGYDHVKQKDKRKMQGKESKYKNIFINHGKI
jgi:probable rRNA maturation factor